MKLYITIRYCTYNDSMQEEYLEIRYVDSDTHSVSYKEKSSKVTDNVTTPYEYARLLSAQAKLIAYGQPPLIEWDGPFDPIAIAKLQIEQRLGSLVIVRKIPDASKPGLYREEIHDIRNMDIRDS